MFHPVCRAAFVVGLSLTMTLPTAVADETPADSAAELKSATSQQLQFVREKVLPLLEARCFECHKQGSEPKGGLTLSGREAMLRGGDSGPAILPGKPEESLLVEAVRYESFEMPPRTRMPKQEVDILVQWIADGAAWPKDLESAPVAAHNHFPLQERRQAHWAWQPIADPPVPVVTSVEGEFSAVDAFVLKQLDAVSLTQAPTADRRTLIRRLYFDLIGLPPSIAQVDAFVKDSRPIEIAAGDVVDQLLASPHFGERWGRHWLDLVRYAETLGHEFDYPLHNAWQYRDYVIRALNADVPYDDFIREHVAGDLLPQPRRHPVEQYNESIIGTGFWYLCEDKHAPVDVRSEEAAKIDNQIDVFSKTFLGMTVACARCHDHKFDAISTADYYALAGFLQSSRRQTAWLDPGQRIESRLQDIKGIRKRATARLNEHLLSSKTANALSPYLLAALELVQSTGTKRDGQPLEPATVAAVAQRYGCQADLLQKWMDVLRDPQTTNMAHPLSLPAMLTQAAPDVPVTDVVAAWQADVQRGLSDQTSVDATDTTLFADLTHGLPAGWFVSGDAFDPSITDGETGPGLQWAESGVRQNLHAGVTSAAFARPLRGTLSSPTFELRHPEILVKVSGVKTRLRLVIDGYLMYEFSELLFNGARQSIDTDGQIRWIRLSSDVTRYTGHRAHLEFLDEGHGWFNVLEVRFANKTGASPQEHSVSTVNKRLAQTTAAAQADTHAAVVREWFNAAGRNSAETTAALFNQGLLPGLPADQEWQKLISEWRQLADSIPDPMSVIAMTEGTPENERVFIRGNPRNLGPEAPRNLLTALRMESSADTEIPAESSGRLQLAEQLVSEDNPLTARVAVNRVWHHLFGAGLVESTDNFGVLGKTPTHPELLDHLATEFRRSDWSLKSLIRTLVLSRTYRASSHASEQARRLDPTNHLLHSANIRRLQGEAVRDAILTVSGRLDRTQFGPAVPVYLTKFMQGRGRPKTNGPLDGNGRRSIYLSVNRNFLSPFMQAFDVPAPVTTIGTRTTSNVPAQALIMLNNEFVNQQAELWARRLHQEPERPATEILHQAWYELFSRPPSADELQDLLLYVEQDPEAGPAPMSVESLTEVCHVLLNSKEFLFLQ